MDINIDDKYIKRGYPPVLLEVDSTMERIQSIISLYKHIIELIEVVKLIKPDWEDNIEHIFFGEDEVLPDDDKAVHLTNNLINFVNDDTKFQSLSQVADTVAQALQTAKDYTDTSIDNLIDGAPAALDTLKELADMLQDEDNAIAVIINNITAINRKIGTLPNVHDATMWDSEGETNMGTCVIGEVQTYQSNYKELLLIKSTIPTYNQGTYLYISSDAVFDGETLIPVYDANLEPLGVNLKILAARNATVEENFDWMKMTFERNLYNSIETLRSWVTANYISKASQQYSTLKVVANNGQHTGSYTNFVKGTVITIPTNSLAFTIKVPATYNAPLITMSGLAVPMVAGTDETIDDVLYHVYTSANAYADNISVQIF